MSVDVKNAMYQRGSSAPKKIVFKCCIEHCNNTSKNSPSIKFYTFPSDKLKYRAEKLRQWLTAINKKNSDGSPWKPKATSRICSEHFIGKIKSEDPRSPNYIPRILPNKKYLATNEAALINRYKFQLKRSSVSNVDNASATKKSRLDEPLVEPSCIPEIDNDVLENDNFTNKKCDKQIQVTFPRSQQSSSIFICNLFHGTTTCDAQTQTEIKTVEFNENYNSADSNGFHGFSSIRNEEELTSLTGVTLKVFNLLKKFVSEGFPDNIKRQIDCDNRLLIFLMKMKCGLTFCSIGVLFQIHRVTVSTIFYSTLQYLVQKCRKFLFWPSKYSVQETMPSSFKPEYSNCRVIIDSTEFIVEQPPSFEQRVQFYSKYKSGFRIKVVVGCTPSGFICLLSKSYGGRASDSQITVSCGLLKLLEPGDLVLADKGFPQIKTLLDNLGKNILLVMPPFLHNQNFTAEEIKETYNVAKVRIHIERVMQRIRTYKIVDKFTTEMLPFVDDILYMCCVLVNLQSPIIQNIN